MSLLRNLGRRKLRTTLTVLGIVIGIWALVVFSSMANKINELVASGSDYYVGKVVVSDGSSSGLGIGLVPIDVGLADQIRTLDGVGAVDPQVQNMCTGAQDRIQARGCHTYPRPDPRRGRGPGRVTESATRSACHGPGPGSIRPIRTCPVVTDDV